MLFGIPFEILASFALYPFPMPEFVCILRHFVCECGSYASALTVTAFSVDRFLAVRKPVHMFLTAKRVRVVRICALVWLISICAAAAFSAQFGVLYFTIPLANCTIRRSAHCTLSIAREMKYSFEASTVLFFLIPGVTIFVLHILIIIRLRASRSVVASLCHRAQSVKNSLSASKSERSSFGGAGLSPNSLGRELRGARDSPILNLSRPSRQQQQQQQNEHRTQALVLYSSQSNSLSLSVDSRSTRLKSTNIPPIREGIHAATHETDVRSRASGPSRINESNLYFGHAPVTRLQLCRSQEIIKRLTADNSGGS